MRLVTRAKLAMTIRVAVAAAPPYVKKTLELQHASARDMLVEDLTFRIMGALESETVILQPELASTGTRSKPDVGGLDEPHPRTGLIRRLPRECITQPHEASSCI